MSEWAEGAVPPKKPVQAPSLSEETLAYAEIQCTSCVFRNMCGMADITNQAGCRARKHIHDDYFAKVIFNTEDPITMNRLRLATHYFVQLMLLRKFGSELTSEEIMLLQRVEGIFDKLYIDKKGDLKDVKSKAAVPWEQDEEVKKLKAEVEEARKMKDEYAAMKAQKKKPEAESGTSQ